MRVTYLNALSFFFRIKTFPTCYFLLDSLRKHFETSAFVEEDKVKLPFSTG